MPASAEQIAANRRNSMRSTGPTSVSGKEKSRCNGLKHGLTGEGIVVARDDEAAIAELSEELQAELQPKTKLGRLLVDRVASMAVRFKKFDKRDSAATANRVRQSAFVFEDSRNAEIEALCAGFLRDPAAVVHKLRRTPEGVDRLIKGLNDLRYPLIHTDRGTWDHESRVWLDRFSGREPGPKSSRIARLTRAIGGDFSALEPHEGAGLDAPERKAWVVSQIHAVIDAEIAVHQAHRDSFGPNFTAIERAEAADIALFDPSKDANLARKYEAAAERSFYRALRELREVESEAAELDETDATAETANDCEELASSLPAPVEAKPAPTPELKRFETESSGRLSQRDFRVRREQARKRGRPVMV